MIRIELLKTNVGSSIEIAEVWAKIIKKTNTTSGNCWFKNQTENETEL